MSRIFFALAFLISLAIPCWASNLCDVEDYMNDLLKKQKPSSILLVLDVDGTLTNYSQPDDDHEILERGNAVNFVTNMINIGVNVVISSAWPEFEETQKRLKELDLLTILKAEKPGIEYVGNLGLKHLNIQFQCYHSGHLSCVKDPGISEDYYRQKSLAYKLVYSDLKEDNITHVVFADDSKGNVQHFMSDLERAKLFSKAEIKTFILSQVDGEEGLK